MKQKLLKCIHIMTGIENQVKENESLKERVKEKKRNFEKNKKTKADMELLILVSILTRIRNEETK